MTGRLFLTILNASDQLAKWAGAEGVPKMLLKHLHSEASAIAETLRQLWFDSPC